MSAPAYDNNGSYPTRAELNAHLGPIREDIEEIKRDVKKLLVRSAGSDAVVRYRRWLVGTSIALVAAVATALALILSSH